MIRTLSETHLTHFHIRVDPTDTLFALVPSRSLYNSVILTCGSVTSFHADFLTIFGFVDLKQVGRNTAVVKYSI